MFKENIMYTKQKESIEMKNVHKTKARKQKYRSKNYQAIHFG